MRLISALFIIGFVSGCWPRLIDTEIALVDTRGVVVKEVIVKGPGGDGFGANFQMQKRWAFYTWDGKSYYRVLLAVALFWIAYYWISEWRDGSKS